MAVFGLLRIKWIIEMKKESASIEEYKTLRSEILAQMNRRSARLTVVWAGISALLAAGIVAQIPELGCVALLLVCTGWMDENRWFRNVIRIGTYISFVLEPRIPGLRWETIQNKIDQINANKQPLKRFTSILFSTYGMFVIVSITISMILFVEFEPTFLARKIIFFSLLAIGIIYSFVNLRNAYIIPKGRKKWEELYSEYLGDIEK